MALKRDLILAALQTALSAISGPTLLVNEPFPAIIPEGGLLILRDARPGEPLEVTLSPVSYTFEAAVPLEIAVQEADTTARDALFASLLQSIQTTLIADKTLGGLSGWVEITGGEPDLLPIEGGDSIKSATINIMVTYITADSLG